MDGQGNLTFIRAWLDEPEGATSDDELGTITSPESGECIESLDIRDSERPSGDMATDSSGLLVRVANGHYESLHDEIELAEVSARRCHLIR